MKIDFVHSSIWQYFVAERLYVIFKAYEQHKNVDEILKCLLDVIVPKHRLDQMILVFFDYFIHRDNWYINNLNDYINLLMNISNYPLTKYGNKLEWISALFRELFRVITLILKKDFTSFLKNFFTVILSEDNKRNFIRYTRITEYSPIISLTDYCLTGCELNGINLSGCNMEGCVMRNSSYKNSCFDNAKLKGAYANNCNFIGVSCQNADLRNVDLSNCNLCGAILKNSRLNGANFENSILEYADLRGAEIKKMNLNQTKMNNCIIDINQLRALGLKETRGIGIQEILDYNIQVYDGIKFLSTDELEKKYQEIAPVSYALWKDSL